MGSRGLEYKVMIAKTIAETTQDILRHSPLLMDSSFERL